MKNRKSSTLLAAVITGFLIMGCGKQTEDVATKDTTAAPAAAESIDRGETTGRIVKIADDKHSISVAHAAIGDWMSAMTMPFTITDTSMISGLAVGDSIRFTVIEETDGIRIGKIEKQ